MQRTKFVECKIPCKKVPDSICLFSIVWFRKGTEERSWKPKLHVSLENQLFFRAALGITLRMIENHIFHGISMGFNCVRTHGAPSNRIIDNLSEGNDFRSKNEIGSRPTIRYWTRGYEDRRRWWDTLYKCVRMLKISRRSEMYLMREKRRESILAGVGVDQRNTEQVRWRSFLFHSPLALLFLSFSLSISFPFGSEKNR